MVGPIEAEGINRDTEPVITSAGTTDELEALTYFLGLKTNYELQRLPWENRWKQALAAYHLTDDLDKVYDGRAKIKLPNMKTKVRGVVSRINKIIWNVSPAGRLEDKKIKKVDKNIVELWNKYIFEHQLENIGFKKAFKMFVRNKAIEGTAVAKITQEFEEKEFTFFEDKEAETITVKDDTFFKNLLLTEFYSDVAKSNIDESQACIHSAAVSMQFLLEHEKREEESEVETEFGTEIVTNTVGDYHNLNLLMTQGKADNITEEQTRYIEFLGLNKTQTGTFQKSMKETRKSGFVQLDECYGKFDLDGDGITEEVVCVIANGRVVIQLEATPFKHKRYVRPFIVGRYEPIANCLYGGSNVMDGKSLLMELNAARAQATDARTRSISNMWYIDETKNVRWDGIWRPNGAVYGQGQSGMTPLINPNLSNVSMEDTVLISKDLDNLWSLSPVQEGTTDQRLIPKTARGTMAVIAQNDLPLNEVIDNTIDDELKQFFEMLYERNLVWKDFDDLLVVWEEKDVAKANLSKDMSMAEAQFEFEVKILGNLELSNEVAHQTGYMAFSNWAKDVPPVAKRLDWQELGNKMLASFGIKDDAEGIWLDDEILIEVDEETKQEQIDAAEGQEGQRQQLRGEARDDATFGTELSTEAKLVEMQAEAAIEKTTGQKVQ